ncbi:MAG TPA: M24 family metallopeptidase [Firmicutes bacterium]|nr:M24 family metallopeptidase [Bacillota bacterium]
MKITLTKVHGLPEVKLTNQVPVYTKEDYERRFQGLATLMQMRGFDHLVIYGDREHFSNICFLTGFEPRFEEALLVFSKDKWPPLLIVGNEGLSFSNIIPFAVNKEVYPAFSLIGQPHHNDKSLKDIFTASGIESHSKVGVVGWKYYPKAAAPATMIDVPYYIVKTLLDLVGAHQIENAADLMLHPEYGLRSKADVKEMVLHEIAGTKTSQQVLHLLRNLRPGLTEMEASQYLQIDGEPLVAHPNVNFGVENTLLGLASPTYTKTLEKGDVVNIALGYRRGMIARTGLFVNDQKEIPPVRAGVVENLYIPYFKALANWYETIGIGVTGGEVYNTVRDTLGDFQKYGVGLNPGHLIHIEEWTSSIFYENSRFKITSGMIIQCDMIAFPGAPYGGVHVEDGLLIADETLRDEIKSLFPDSWQRIMERKRFIREELGITLQEEILPTSNIQLALFPFMGDTSIVLRKN